MSRVQDITHSGKVAVSMLVDSGKPQPSPRNYIERGQSPSRVKFNLKLREDIFLKLKQEARQRDISVQELLRAIVVPEWFMNDKNTMGD